MTTLPIAAKIINVDSITYAENDTWRESNDPNSPQVSGVTIHFVGGSALRLSGDEAAKVRTFLGLTAK